MYMLFLTLLSPLYRSVWTLIFIIPFFRMFGHLYLLFLSSECLSWFLLIFSFSFLYHDCPFFFFLLFYIHLPAPSFRLAIRFTRAPRPTRPMLASLLLAILGALVLIPQPIFFLFFSMIQYIYIYTYNCYYIHLSYFMFYVLCFIILYFILEQLGFGLHIAAYLFLFVLSYFYIVFISLCVATFVMLHIAVHSAHSRNLRSH